MLDVTLILVVIAFFGLCALMVRWCATVIGPGDEIATEDRADTHADTAAGASAGRVTS